LLRSTGAMRSSAGAMGLLCAAAIYHHRRTAAARVVYLSLGARRDMRCGMAHVAGSGQRVMQHAACRGCGAKLQLRGAVAVAAGLDICIY
jgi:hypothetical protein